MHSRGRWLLCSANTPGRVKTRLIKGERHAITHVYSSICNGLSVIRCYVTRTPPPEVDRWELHNMCFRGQPRADYDMTIQDWESGMRTREQVWPDNLTRNTDSFARTFGPLVRSSAASV